MNVGSYKSKLKVNWILHINFGIRVHRSGSPGSNPEPSYQNAIGQNH